MRPWRFSAAALWSGRRGRESDSWMKAKHGWDMQALHLSATCVKNVSSFIFDNTGLFASVGVSFFSLDLSSQTCTCSRTLGTNRDVQGITALTWAPVNTHVPRCLLQPTTLQSTQEVWRPPPKPHWYTKHSLLLKDKRLKKWSKKRFPPSLIFNTERILNEPLQSCV